MNKSTSKIHIATWNVNSIRIRLECIEKWLKQNHIDIILFQEIKCESDKFPNEFFEDLGYNIKILGQKSYNGVAIASLGKLEDEFYFKDTDSRYLECLTTIKSKVLRIASVYAPNGQSFDSEKFQEKIEFFKILKNRMKELLNFKEATIIGGDFNVAPNYLDTYIDDGRILCSKIERQLFNQLLSIGFIDAFRAIHKDERSYSWFDYRGKGFEKNHGMRIDHFLLSPKAADLMDNCIINHAPRSFEKTSDHTPVQIELSINS